MSANFYELLKYARTGLASPEMTAYDKLKAMAMCGGGLSPYTIIGQPPISFLSDGTPLTSVTIKGNGQQNGTPSPQNIVPFDGSGERTGNLFDYQTMANGVAGKFLDETGTENGSNAWTITDYIPVNGTVFTVGKLGGNAPAICLYDANKVLIAGKKYATGSAANKSDITITTSADAKYVRFSWYSGDDSNRDDISAIILNSGSSPLPYEPYGYKIPLTCAGQTVPIYLGQTPTVRRVKKLVLDGTESWTRNDPNMYIQLPDILRSSEIVCTHYKDYNDYTVDMSVTTNRGSKTTIWFNDSRFVTSAQWKQYLAAQYAAGTPVTIWYVLAEPETGIVNEPLAKIGDYCDELHSSDAAVTIPTANGDNTLTVDTDLQPSSMTITGHIK